ncbi:MAG: hypothetical protein WA138_10060 [Parvibaculum sp.]
MLLLVEVSDVGVIVPDVSPVAGVVCGIVEDEEVDGCCVAVAPEAVVAVVVEVNAGVVLVVSAVPVVGVAVVVSEAGVVVSVEVAVVVSSVAAGVVVASVGAGVMGSGLWPRSGFGSLGDCGLSGAAARSASTSTGSV